MGFDALKDLIDLSVTLQSPFHRQHTKKSSCVAQNREIRSKLLRRSIPRQSVEWKIIKTCQINKTLTRGSPRCTFKSARKQS